MSVIIQFIQFLRSYKTDHQPTIWLLIRTWSVFYVIVICITLAITTIFPEIGTSLQPIKLQEFLTQDTIAIVILLTVFIGPLMEELLFRAGMKWGGRNVSWLLGALLFLIIKYFTLDRIGSLHMDQWLKTLVSFVIFISCVVLCFHIFKPLFPRLSRIYSKWPGVIFWLLTLGFGFAHLSNFDLSSTFNILLLLAVVPQMILGVMLGFVRIKWGLQYSILIHMFHNLIQLIPILLLRHATLLGKDMMMRISEMNYTDMIGTPWFMVGIVYILFLFVIISRSIFLELYYLFSSDSFKSFTTSE